MITKTKSICSHWGAVCLLLAANMMAGHVIAATTDLSTTPLVTSGATTVLPNVFLMMDDSGSMDWDFIPDYPPGSAPFSTSKFGYASNQCNGVFYNPAITYSPPVKYDGTYYPDSSFTAAWMDGYKTSQGTLNLSTTFTLGLSQSSGVPGSGVPAYYYKYTGSQTTSAQKNYYNSSSTFYTECNTTATNSPTATITVSGSSNTSVTGITVNGTQIMSGASTASTSASTVAANIASKITLGGYSATSSGTSTVTITGPNSAAGYLPVVSTSGSMTITPHAFAPFYKVLVSSTSGIGSHVDERTNFANWFSYYRTRLNMMKTGSGVAFGSLDNHYRVGFATMNNNGGSKFLNLSTFDSTQKNAWYTMLYSAYANNSTPLLRALSNVGLMYAHKLPSNTLNGVAAADPVQYSCQQNFTLLSTDGFWTSATNYNLAGGTVGQQDGAAARPYNDGAQSTSTTKTDTVTVTRKETDTPKTTTKTWTRTYKFTAATTGTGGCNGSKYLVTSQPQKYIETIVTTLQSIDDFTHTDTTTVTVTNGVSTTTNSSSDTSANVSTTTVPVSDTGAPSGSTTWSNNGSASTSCSSNPNPSAGNNSATTPTSTSSTATGSPTTTTISVTGPTTGAPVTTTSSTGGTSNTLADVAYYYYMTDIRNSSLSNCTGALGGSINVCTDDVPRTGQDTASWQHMTTFTLGLGAFGRMVYSPTYATDTSGDYFSVANGSLANIAGGVCTWGTNGQACNWPTPNVSGTPENIDDLWHAAVNGRGAYFSATDPNSLASGLANALAGISARLGASAAATTSNPNVTSGDNFLFSSTFDTSIWDGDLFRQQLDLTTGTVSSTTVDWSAQARFDTGAITAATRTVYTYDSSNPTTHIKQFKWATLTGTEQNYFNLAAIGTLSQFCTVGFSCLSAASQTSAAGSTLVDFIRGDRTNEGADTDTSKYYRLRDSTSNPHPNIVLGDIVNSEAVYVKGSLFTYNDSGYSAFITTNSTRDGRVYVGSNDGMLHSFDSTTGDEKWAYIPSFVMPNLYKLADKNYSSLHQYSVDGTPVVSDVYFSGAWHTILVGGLNGGGRGYYALDITDANAAPKVLWEYSTTNMGYTFGNPVITKLSDGTWAVLVTSGYNNVTPGDGIGHLYVLRASDGALIRSINTTVGSTTTPSGLGKINAWVNTGMLDNTAVYVYGGDLLGNLWRFDINNGTVQLVVTLKDSLGNIQPITVKPELGDVSGKHMVYVGTGRFLGTTDLSTTSQQSFYGIKDPWTTMGSPTTPIYASSRTGFIQQVQTTTTCPAGSPATVCSTGEIVRTSTSYTVNLSSDNGWFIDLPDSGERDNTDPTLGLGTLVFNTNVPSADACNAGGYSYSYFLDYRTGAAVTTAQNIGSVRLGSAIATRAVLVHLPNNTVVELTRLSNGTTVTGNVPINSPASTTRRVSWRELLND